MKKLLFLALFNSLFIIQVSAKDCVDCSFGIEGFPTLSSLQEASCTDCGCYTKTHNDMIEGLLPERATLVRSRISEDLGEATSEAVKNIARLDKLLKNIPNINQDEVNGALASCNLQKIKANVSSCASAKNPKHMQELFGSDNIDGVLSNLAAKFSEVEGGENKSRVSCLSSSQIDQLTSNRKIVKFGRSLVMEIKKFQSKSKRQSLEAAMNLDSSNALSEILIDSIGQSEFSSILRNEEAFKYLVGNIESLINPDGTLADAKILDFFSTDVYKQFPSISTEVIVEI